MAKPYPIFDYAMKKISIILIIVAAACLGYYIHLSGVSFKSLTLLFLANGFGICVFALLLSTVGKKIAQKAAENIDKRINDTLQQKD